jgi:hypothetical protein
VADVSAVDELAKAGIQYIVYWSKEQPGSQLIAAHFGHAFCAALRNPVTTVPEVSWCLQHYNAMHAEFCIQRTQQVLAALLPEKKGAQASAEAQPFSRCILPSAAGQASAVCSDKTKAAV